MSSASSRASTRRGSRPSATPIASLTPRSAFPPCFILASEIAVASDAFAVKFADIAARHIVLEGKDPFAGLTVTREAAVRRLRQVLVNLVLRLRERYALASRYDDQMALAAAEAVGPLRACAATLLTLEGEAPVAPREALDRVVGAGGAAALAAITRSARARQRIGGGRRGGAARRRRDRRGDRGARRASGPDESLRPPWSAIPRVLSRSGRLVVIAFRLALRRIESGQRPELPLNDPYQIAFLLGGAAQAARIAVMSLIDRGLLEVTGIEIERRGEKSSG